MRVQTERRKAQISAADLPPAVMCSSAGSCRRFCPPPRCRCAASVPHVLCTALARRRDAFTRFLCTGLGSSRPGGWLGRRRRGSDWGGVETEDWRTFYQSRFSPTTASTCIGKGRDRKAMQTSAPGCRPPLGLHVVGPTRHWLGRKMNKWEFFWLNGRR
jgi:hypothetical protein